MFIVFQLFRLNKRPPNLFQWWIEFLIIIIVVINIVSIVILLVFLYIKACGHDNNPVQLIKDSAPYISHPLAYIINFSLETGKIPDELKIAKVTPLHKKEPREDPGNYRPMSVLPKKN